MVQDSFGRRKLRFMGSSAKDLRDFPENVRRIFGYEIDTVQCGKHPHGAKMLKSVPGVLELSRRYDGDTYRAVYAANIGGVVYILHCFKKKSKHGIATPKEDMDLIRQRLKEAMMLSEGARDVKED